MSPPALGIQIIQKLTSYYFKVENLKEEFQVSNSSWKKKRKKNPSGFPCVFYRRNPIVLSSDRSFHYFPSDIAEHDTR